MLMSLTFYYSNAVREKHRANDVLQRVRNFVTYKLKLFICHDACRRPHLKNKITRHPK